jgi:hypothetical protein
MNCPVRPSDVQAVAEEITRAWEEWQRSGGAWVGAEQVERAEQAVREIEDAAWEASPSRHRLEWPTISYYRAVAALRRAGERLGLEWYLLAFVGAATLCGAAIILGAFVSQSFASVLLASALFFCIGYAATAFLSLSPPDGALLTRLEQLEAKRANRLRVLETSEDRLRDARATLDRLSHLHRLLAAHERLVARHRQLRQQLLSRKNQLLLRDWRVLRGAEFEGFLAEVFETLGFSVQTTKASGDQGVDLIVVKGDNRLAIQAKGYEGSVGNTAVQEAFSGMTFYGCNSCVVITNSEFTRGAYELAKGTGCYLVDGQLIPTLIEGVIF